MTSNIIALALVLPVFLFPSIGEPKQPQICRSPEPQITVLDQDSDLKAVDEDLLSHAQETWISALEWCESNGKESIINKEDSDGTPSYYAFQFKPGTFRVLGVIYGVIDKGHSDEEIMSLMKQTSLQRQIVRAMIKDKNTVWEKQFPGCVARIGRPPVY